MNRNAQNIRARSVCTLTRSHDMVWVHWYCLAGVLKQQRSVASATQGNAQGVEFIP